MDHDQFLIDVFAAMKKVRDAGLGAEADSVLKLAGCYIEAQANARAHLEHIEMLRESFGTPHGNNPLPLP